jgi:perosamine synthetase
MQVPGVIRLAMPSIGVEELEAAAAVLRSGHLVQGERVKQFEYGIARIAGTTHAVAVSSGTAALQLALLTLGVGPGDRVAVPTYSWPASANVVALCGAEPVFVDIDPATFNMDPAALERAVLRWGPVKVVLPVHAFGGMADMPALLEVAARIRALVVEDAACALGASLNGRAAGQWGDLGCFSFHPRKIVTTGEGGAVTTNRACLARQVRLLRNHGLDPDASAPDFVGVGFNYRLTEFQGALGAVQLDRLPVMVERRRTLARRYERLLSGTRVLCPASLAATAHVYQAYVVLLPGDMEDGQSRVIGGLRAHGVEATIGTHHIPLTRHWAAVGGYRPGDFPVTDGVARRAVALPMHMALSDQDQEQVVRALTSLVAGE